MPAPETPPEWQRLKNEAEANYEMGDISAMRHFYRLALAALEAENATLREQLSPTKRGKLEDEE